MVGEPRAVNNQFGKTSSYISANSRCELRVLSLLLVGAFFSQVTAITINCIDKNPFIQTLASKGVQVYSTPITANSTTCWKEWSVHKTCCLASSLVTYASTEGQQMSSAIQGASYELISLANALNSFLTPLGSIWSTLNTSSANQTFQTDLAKLKTFTNSLTSLSAADSQAHNQCASRVKYLKGQSLCAACSGRSESLFASQRIRITMQDCKLTVGICSYSWNRMVALVDHMVLAESIVNTMKYLFPKFLHSIDMNKVAPLEAWIEANQVKTAIRNCVNLTAASCDFNSLKTQCENFISLQKKSFTEAALNLVSDELPTLNAVKLTTVSIKYALETEPGTLLEANTLASSAGEKLYSSPSIAITDPLVAQQNTNLNLGQTSIVGVNTLVPVMPKTLWSIARRRLQFSSSTSAGSNNMTTPTNGMGGDTQCDSNDRPEDCEGCMTTDCQFP